MTAPAFLSAASIHVSLGDKHVLQGVSISFHKGEVTAIVGPNGAGKSTLLNALAGLYRPDTGEIRLGERDIFALPARERAQCIGFLPQIPEIAWDVDARVFAGLGRIPFAASWGPSAEDMAAVDRALALTGADVLAERNVKTLSGGERARVLLARVLAGEPEWLLADEPMTALDPGYQLDIATLFRGLAAGGQGIIVTMHDLQMALKVADRVVMLAEGKILADGAPAFALSPSILSAAYGIDARYVDGQAGPVLEIVKRRD